MTRTLVLAAADLAVGVFLIQYARHRERRDPDGVAVVGVVMVFCALMLVAFTAWHHRPLPTEGPSSPPVPPTGPLATRAAYAPDFPCSEAVVIRASPACRPPLRGGCHRKSWWL